LEELGPHRFSPQELPIVQRVIHATADFDYARQIVFSQQAIAAGLAAIRAGCLILTDVQMAAVGLNRGLLDRFGCQARCLVHDPETAALAQAEQLTRSAAAIRRMVDDLAGSIVAVGNAPTALFELLRLVDAAHVRPALVVGVPVGFVNAAESKAALQQTDLAFMTVAGRKGGSTVAAAMVNALLRLAEG
jgi:precorrin-8X/cobalt-precorrin-8 methylmutase